MKCVIDKNVMLTPREEGFGAFDFDFPPPQIG